jgi:replicative DNA helicase
LRQPPQAIESEQSILGALLLDPGAYDRIEWLPEAAFFTAGHRMIYGAIVSLIEAGRGVDALLVGDTLAARKQLEDAGGREYLGELGANTPGSSNIKRHAELVHERYLLRSVMAAAMTITDKAQAPGVDPKALAEEAEATFLSILDTKKGGEEVSFAAIIAEAIEARENPQKTIVPTSFPNLDRSLNGGMKGGQLLIVAARPGMGKSAFVQNVAENVAKHKHVAYFSLEMNGQEIGERSLKYHERVDGQDAAALRLMKLPISVDLTPAVSLGHIRLRTRRIRRRHGLGLIVVDYLQLMTGKGENRTQEIGSLSRGLKALAKEMNVPVIAGCQLNRGVEARADNRPLLSDLREAGDIEQDADVVLMIYRDDYYNADSPAAGLAEILIKKQRNGPQGMVPMRFDQATTRFHSYEGPMPQAPQPARSGRVVAHDFKSRAAGD